MQQAFEIGFASLPEISRIEAVHLASLEVQKNGVWLMEGARVTSRVCGANLRRIKQAFAAMMGLDCVSKKNFWNEKRLYAFDATTSSASRTQREFLACLTQGI